jgi:DNA helicase-2/ATP-dependent DNA helicase PcrA
MTTKIFVASAGSGKTTRLMDELDELLDQGVQPERIVYTTFTKAAATEARDRAIARFKLDEKKFRHFRTLNSFCYQNTANKKDIMSSLDYSKFGLKIGYKMRGYQSKITSLEDLNQNAGPGDELLTLDNYRRSKLCSYKDACKAQDDHQHSPDTLKHFAESYVNYKDEVRKGDFVDQIERYISEGFFPEVDYVFADEAQDFSALQWMVVDKIAQKAKTYFIAGDDKQAIYEFSGGDPKALIDKVGEREVLDKCYRLPANVLAYAEKIANNIETKTPYKISAVNGGGGVHHVQSLTGLPLDEGSWFMLARNKAYLPYFEKELLRQKMLYTCADSTKVPKGLVQAIETWKRLLAGEFVEARDVKPLYADFLKAGQHVAKGFKKVMAQAYDDDTMNYELLTEEYGLNAFSAWETTFCSISDKLKTYLKSVEEAGNFGSASRIELSTIHGTKGREADNVILLPDQSPKTWMAGQVKPDTEHRVFYVGATRAKQRLFIMAPLTDKFYQLPY